METTNQEFDLGSLTKPAVSKTDWFMKIFVTVILVIIEIVFVGVVSKLTIENNALDPLVAGIVNLIPFFLAVGIIYLIWRADVISDDGQPL